MAQSNPYNQDYHQNQQPFIYNPNDSIKSEDHL